MRGWGAGGGGDGEGGGFFGEGGIGLLGFYKKRGMGDDGEGGLGRDGMGGRGLGGGWGRMGVWEGKVWEEGFRGRKVMFSLGFLVMGRGFFFLGLGRGFAEMEMLLGCVGWKGSFSYCRH